MNRCSRDAEQYGFLPDNTPDKNLRALQAAVDGGGHVVIDRPGVYDINGTVCIGDDTDLEFGAGVRLRKQPGPDGQAFYVFLNRGAFSRTFNRNIRIRGLKLVCNGVDMKMDIPGLRGQLSFFYVKNLVVQDYECLDLGKVGYGIHICTFEDVLVENVHIEGEKDAVHFGRGSRFILRRGLFRTFDDPIALNAYDYADSNPQFGWIENGLIEECVDLEQSETTGFFCRMLAGAWSEWRPGMEIQNSDLVISNGKLYSAHMKPDGKLFFSRTAPTHAEGFAEHDGIRWRVAQEDFGRQCGCRNIHFRNIRLEKTRAQAFRLHFGNNRYSRSIYPGESFPMQENILLENIVCSGQVDSLLTANTPVDCVRIVHSTLNGNNIVFETLDEVPGTYPPVRLLIEGTAFLGKKPCIVSSVPGRPVILKVAASVATEKSGGCAVEGNVHIEASDFRIKTKKRESKRNEKRKKERF